MEHVVQVHTHIFQTEKTLAVVKATSETLDWKTFFFFEKLGDEYAAAVFPQIQEYWVLRPKIEP